jgi:hypothetical protein
MHKKLNFDELFIQFQASAKRIEALASQVSDEQARWKPDSESWSLLEVVNHLYDEEMLDFAPGLKSCSRAPGRNGRRLIRPPGWSNGNTMPATYLPRSNISCVKERNQSNGCPAWKTRIGGPAQARPGDGKCLPGKCSHPGLPMTCSTSASWSNCTGPGSSSRLAITLLAMPGTGKSLI